MARRSPGRCTRAGLVGSASAASCRGVPHKRSRNDSNKRDGILPHRNPMFIPDSYLSRNHSTVARRLLNTAAAHWFRDWAPPEPLGGPIGRSDKCRNASRLADGGYGESSIFRRTAARHDLVVVSTTVDICGQCRLAAHEKARMGSRLISSRAVPMTPEAAGGIVLSADTRSMPTSHPSSARKGPRKAGSALRGRRCWCGTRNHGE